MIATIGYESASLEDFIATLHLGGVEVLVDIRDRAQSRRKGFSKTALSEAVNEAGIKYVHFKALGDPKAGRDAARAGRHDEFVRIFTEVMNTEDAKTSLNEIQDMAQFKTVCLMCYERDPNSCHRKIVSDYLKMTFNFKINHLGVINYGAKRSEAG